MPMIYVSKRSAGSFYHTAHVRKRAGSDYANVPRKNGVSTSEAHSDARALQEGFRGFWCCDNSDCSYREFPRERKQTPQVALEVSSPTTFMVSTGRFCRSLWRSLTALEGTNPLGCAVLRAPLRCLNL